MQLSVKKFMVFLQEYLEQFGEKDSNNDDDDDVCIMCSLCLYHNHILFTPMYHVVS